MHGSIRFLIALALPVCIATDGHAGPCNPPLIGSRSGTHHLEIVSNKPFVTVRLNDSRPLHFILDAGCPFTLVNRGLAQQIGFEPGPDTTLVGGFAPSFLPKACVRVLGVTLQDITLGEIELDHVASVEGVRLDGLVGGELFARYVVLIDYPHGSIQVFPASFDYHGDGVIVPIDVDGLAFTEASLQGPDGTYVRGRFIVDTGVRMALLLNEPFVEENGLLTGEKRVPGTTVGVGVHGETRGDVFRVRDMRLGGLHVPDVIAVAARDGVVVDPTSGDAGIIGGDFLRRFRVYFDYPHHRLILESTPHSGEPFVYDASGMFLLAEGDDLRTIRVHRVIPHSPADDAGIRAGDRMVSIDGRLTQRLGLERTRGMLRDDARRYRVLLERQGGMVIATLVTAELLKTRAAVTDSGGRS